MPQPAALQEFLRMAILPLGPTENQAEPVMCTAGNMRLFHQCLIQHQHRSACLQVDSGETDHLMKSEPLSV